MIATVTMTDGTVKVYDVPNIMYLDVCPNMTLGADNPAVTVDLTDDNGKVHHYTVGKSAVSTYHGSK